MNWLYKLIWPTKPVEGYRLIGAVDRRQEQEIRVQILLKIEKEIEWKVNSST